MPCRDTAENNFESQPISGPWGTHCREQSRISTCLRALGDTAESSTAGLVFNTPRGWLNPLRGGSTRGRSTHPCGEVQPPCGECSTRPARVSSVAAHVRHGSKNCESDDCRARVCRAKKTLYYMILALRPRRRETWSRSAAAVTLSSWSLAAGVMAKMMSTRLYFGVVFPTPAPGRQAKMTSTRLHFGVVLHPAEGPK